MRNLLSIVFISCTIGSFGQFKIEKSQKIRKDIQSTLASGTGITISSVSHKGKDGSFGLFTNGKDLIGLENGFFVSTGFAKDIQQENSSGGTSGKTYNGGIPFLDELSGVKTNDGTEIIVDFKAEDEYISFNFVFGSEEYPEYASSQFNDSYAFTIKGEGYERETNIALVPNTYSYIGINSVNHFNNEEYYISNSMIPGYRRKKEQKVDTVFFTRDDLLYAVIKDYNIENSKLNKATFPIEFDGFTKVMQVGAKVVPGEIYTLRILIADGSDRKLDSGVFIEKGSFNSHPNKDFTYGIVGEPGYYYNVDTVFIRSLVNENKLEELHEEKETKETAQTIELNYFFDTDSWTLSEVDLKDIKSHIRSFKDSTVNRIEISGYTDDIASPEYNNMLGQKRAETIKSILIKGGVSEGIIYTFSVGEVPLEGHLNLDEERAKNRKVVIKLVSN